MVNWAVELESPLDLERSGWNMNSLKPGDSVTVQGIRARDGSPQVWGNSVVLTSTNKKVLAMSPEALAALKPVASNQPALPVPRWPDGKPRLGAAPGETGYWARPSSTVLMETGAKVEMDGSGLLKNLKDSEQGRAVPAVGARSLRAPPAQFPEWRSDVSLLQAAGRAAAVSDAVRESVSGRQDLRADFRHGRRRQS